MGVMKGVLAAAKAAVVIDLCHDVPPQDVRTAALFLRSSVPFFQNGTVFLCVVDPGVGSSRRILYARTKRHQYLAPDNGLLSWIPDPVIEWRSVENKKLFLKAVSSTFHGRDIFAPVGARLSRGLKSASLGPAIKDPVRLEFPKKGVILAIDRFGNAITSIEGAVKSVRYNGKEIPVGRSYSDVAEGEPLALVGSSGLVELSIRNGSFAERSLARKGNAIDFTR